MDVDVDNMGIDVDMGVAEEPNVEPVVQIPPKLSTRKTSIVWKQFDQVFEKDKDGVVIKKPNGKALMKAVCKICSSKLVFGGSSGTTHLKRHMIRCVKRTERVGGQTIVGRTETGGIYCFTFNQERTRKETVRYIIREELPFNKVDKPTFKRYEHEPSFRNLCESIKLKYDKYWKDIPKVLGLASCMDPRYKLTVLELCLDLNYDYVAPPVTEANPIPKENPKLKEYRVTLYELFEEYSRKMNQDGSVVTEATISSVGGDNMKHGYIGEFEYVEDHRSGKIVVELNRRLNKCGVISPRFDVGVKDIEPWTARLLPSRQENYGMPFYFTYEVSRIEGLPV
ncbi:hypothetical protein IFM89_001152 [Coptis chinensis]|uniref:BED-type domain-containing protein n=1 Tax=Coptis chinensis TaxID=261450 RepID=A0A835M972_9MAGN|nr:hypothetical protein IFM89_001152 [Coptis chinensis]